jgi:hypothetical protein
MKNESTSLLESIPDAEAIRALLAQKLREAGILRQLLKAAERKRMAENIRQQSAAKGRADAR